MLKNGLGELLDTKVSGATRFVDLFCGSAAVSHYVATRTPITVIACDLQHYGAILAGAVITRQRPLQWKKVWQLWVARAKLKRGRHAVPEFGKVSKKSVDQSREWASKRRSLPITRSYGGYYFSVEQAVWIDALRASVPPREPQKSCTIAALVRACSRIIAAPGHTAQPFQPSSTGKRYLAAAWSQSVLKEARRELEALSNTYAKATGTVFVSDACAVARTLKKGDLAFVDPPYSGVHYSRFYHVLEAISRGTCGPVAGAGRYPATEFRPKSQFSLRSESQEALRKLLEVLAQREVDVILTFPNHDCSNGLSGRKVINMAAQFFSIDDRRVKSTFSSLGGKSGRGSKEAARNARLKRTELILSLSPRLTPSRPDA